MKRLVLALTLAALVVVVAGGSWYFFGKTLRLSDIAGEQQDPMAAAAVRLFDFNTKLTRYDLFTLRQRAKTWNERLGRAQALVSPAERAAEIDRVFTEIAQDPAARKFLSGFGVLGKDDALQLLRDML